MTSSTSQTHEPKRSTFKWHACVALFALATANMALAAHPKLSAELQEAAGAAPIEVIVQFKQTPTAHHHQLVAMRGGELKQDLSISKAGHYSVPASSLVDLANDPEVAYITPNRPLQGTMDIPAATVNAAAAVTANYDGAGIAVAVIDSGMADIPEFHGQHTHIVYQGYFIGGSAVDQWGHGTHVAGLIGSNGSGTVYTGIVPNVNIVNLRALDQNGNGTDASVINAINTAISLKSKYNIRVINLSLGRPVFEAAALDPLCQAVEAAWKAGIVVVVAAGNQGRNNSSGSMGYGTISAPGNDPYVITVGAMKDMHTSSRADDLIASYSSKGPTSIDHYVKPDILAPGNKIVSTMNAGVGLLQQYPQNKVINNEYLLSGTSMAAPMVSGAAVVLLQQHPSLNPDQVKGRLMKTASKTFPVSSTAVDSITGLTYTSQYDIFTVGAGYLDISAAMNNNDLAAGSALSPTAVYDPKRGQVIIRNTYSANAQGATATWGTTTVWGDTAVWGTTTVWGDTAIWGSSVWLNGSTTVWGDTAIWGSTAIWATSGTTGFTTVWGDTAIWGTSSQTASESLNVLLNGDK